MKTKKIVAMVMVLVLSLGMCVGCGTASKDGEKDSLTYVGLKVYDPTYVAIEKGFFKEQGLDVKLTDVVAGGATAVQMVSSGDVQGCLLSNMALCNAVNSGMPVKAVADIQSAFRQAPLEEFYIKADSGIKSIKDLKGKKIAINLVKSSFHYTWLMELEKNGMTEKDVTFVSLPFAEQREALLNGKVDAIGLMQPYSGMARNDKKCKQLFNAVDSFGERQFCEILLNSVWAKEHPSTAKKFVTGLAKASKWIENNQAEAKKIIAKYTGIDAKYIDDYYFQPNCKVNMNDAKYWLEYMKKHEGVRGDISVEDIATNEYNGEMK